VRVESPKRTKGSGLVGLTLRHRDVGDLVAPDHLGLIFGAVGERDRDLLDHRVRPRRRDDVIVGDDLAVGRDDEAGAERAAALGDRALAPAAAFGASPPKRRKNSSKPGGNLLLAHGDASGGSRY
jgi:hypothetical protein